MACMPVVCMTLVVLLFYFFSQQLYSGVWAYHMLGGDLSYPSKCGRVWDNYSLGRKAKFKDKTKSTCIQTWTVCSRKYKLRHCSLSAALGGWCVAFVVAQEAAKWVWQLRVVTLAALAKDTSDAYLVGSRSCFSKYWWQRLGAYPIRRRDPITGLREGRVVSALAY